MKYLIIDGMLSGTGIRDQYEGLYLEPESLGISVDLIVKLKIWLKKYEDEHFNGFKDQNLIEELDNEGIEIAKAFSSELADSKISYFSDANLTTHLI